jgi:hypothetical protein
LNELLVSIWSRRSVSSAHQFLEQKLSIEEVKQVCWRFLSIDAVERNIYTMKTEEKECLVKEVNRLQTPACNG